jgi:hypothetical protein
VILPPLLVTNAPHLLRPPMCHLVPDRFSAGHGGFDAVELA